MLMNTLRAHLRSLMSLAESEAPLISCYADLGDPRSVTEVEAHFRILRGGSGPARRRLVDAAMERVRAALAAAAHLPGGLAVFARAGTRPFELVLELKVSVATRLVIDQTPHVFELVQLKDDYERYLLLILGAETTRLVEVSLGEVSRELWTATPELRRRVGRDWARLAYQRRRGAGDEDSLAELVAVLRQQARAGGRAHLVLAGSPSLGEALVRRLPADLARLVVDIVPASDHASTEDVAAVTLASYLESEEQESLAVVAELWHELTHHGLAVADTEPTLRALCLGVGDRLVIARAYASPRGWACSGCSEAGSGAPPKTCPACGRRAPRPADLREALVALAELHGVHVEVVEYSELLMALGGVGCLIRRALEPGELTTPSRVSEPPGAESDEDVPRPAARAST